MVDEPSRLTHGRKMRRTSLRLKLKVCSFGVDTGMIWTQTSIFQVLHSERDFELVDIYDPNIDPVVASDWQKAKHCTGRPSQSLCHSLQEEPFSVDIWITNFLWIAKRNYVLLLLLLHVKAPRPTQSESYLTSSWTTCGVRGSPIRYRDHIYIASCCASESVHWTKMWGIEQHQRYILSLQLWLFTRSP